jgi:aldose sugar dehydrogenase
MKCLPTAVLLLLCTASVAPQAQTARKATATAARKATPRKIPPGYIETLYKSMCAECHGANMEGGRAPSMLDSIWIHGGDDESIARTIKNGVPAKGMPAWGKTLTDAQIRQVVVYMREVRAGPRPFDYETPVPHGAVTTEVATYRAEVVVDSGELEMPWSLAFLPDGRLLVTEQTRWELKVVEHGKAVAVKGVPQGVGTYSGYFGVALHPDYASNGWIYLAYKTVCDSCAKNYYQVGTLVLIRGRLENDEWKDSETLLQLPTVGMVTAMTGRIAFDENKHVFLSMGTSFAWQNEKGVRSYQPGAQDLSHGMGKIHRLNDDGTIPADNPFIGKPGALASIWSYGHRNPQGLAFDHNTKTLWSSEHGPRGGDELNLIQPGKNYGWPIVSMGMDYTEKTITFKTHAPGMEDPVVFWTPSIAVSAIAFYEGEQFPQWKHNLFVSSLADRTLFRLVLENGKVTHREVIEKGWGRIRDVQVSPDGYIYMILEFRSSGNPFGRIVRLVPVVGA